MIVVVEIIVRPYDDVVEIHMAELANVFTERLNDTTLLNGGRVMKTLGHDKSTLR